ncbi:hypothetical protein CPB84DRAFT_1244280 [Gymnopilus junonius]|uniref:Uncharacterized protein n=1 Tax=Gymnopilus junonius TaxID=109634 RepID=A0A9P5TLY4_GYMJU|nr:hypothetical protein CPB84DRAFT_1244280 [Gymnopilus junonius]
MEPQVNHEDALKAYGSYPFSSDETYQQGVASLFAGGAVDPNAPAEVHEDVKRRTRVFYFNKITGNSITAEEVCDYELLLQQSLVERKPAEDKDRVLTFAELKELIESGNVDKIPNNKVIPDVLNEAPPSQSTAPMRKKPWEEATDS